MFAGQVVIITGGGTGLGYGAAEIFFNSGAQLALLGRREEVLSKAALALDPTGERVRFWPCDTRDAQRVSEVVESILASFGHIDVLVNNAGGQFPAPAENISPRGFEAVVRNNLLGTWNMIHAVANQAMIPAHHGVIVNVIANMARGFPGMVHTGAARAGVDNITKTLATEWARFGIRINAIAPGVIKTEALSRYPEGILTLAEGASPMKRLGEVQEVVVPLCFFASPWASFITGQTLYVDGGGNLSGDLWPIGGMP